MTRDQAGQFAKLLAAYAAGMTIQCNTHGDWVDGVELRFGLSPDHYRIKPELHDFLWAVQQARDETGYTCRDSDPEFVLTKRNGSLCVSAYKKQQIREVSIDEALATDWRFHNNGE